MYIVHCNLQMPKVNSLKFESKVFFLSLNIENVKHLLMVIIQYLSLQVDEHTCMYGKDS